MTLIILCSLIAGLILGVTLTPLINDLKKVKDGKKPFGWWAHWLLCEMGWYMRNRIDYGWVMYYKHLNKMCDKYKITLYGRKLT